MEKFKGIKFPKCLKTFLRHAAYDTKSSCMLLDTKTITDMEIYIQESGAEIIADLDCCNSATYRSQKQFRFLPGHRSSILSIPDQIREMDTVEKKKKKPMLEFKKLLTPTELKIILLTRLNHGLIQNGIESCSFCEVHLSDVRTMIISNQLNAKCSVQCFQCNVSVSSLYKGYWNIGNIMRHMRTHFSADIAAQPQGSRECVEYVHSSPKEFDSRLMDELVSG